MSNGNSGKNEKFVKDCLYKQIRIPPLCQEFIDTPEFQNLRWIKQLGHVHYVYPSAVHTRLEHSFGVMHLAGMMVDTLDRQPGVNITPRERDLIQLAGLLHDIGHHAYSHFFDHFVRDLPANIAPGVTKHETRSLLTMLTINNRIKALSKSEIAFVGSCILGTLPPEDSYHDRPYLFEIVCNSHCGVDVDKMDYLLRDAYHTGMHGFQSDYIIINAKVDPTTKHIAFAHKTRIDIKDLFSTRQRMHENVYRHHTVRKIEKIYHCMMRRILHDYEGLIIDSMEALEYDNDVLLEAQLQKRFGDTLYQDLQQHDLDHDCEFCESYDLDAPITQSGSINEVIFV